MSKPVKKCKKSDTINLATDISALSERITKLKASNNLNEQIKERTTIQNKIKALNDFIEGLKTKLASDDDNSSNESDESYDFAKSFEEIERLSEEIWNEEDITKQIEIFNTIKHGVSDAVSYLEKKKMEVKIVE
jgi:conjugal transfer/entry exclusion protein